MSAGNYTHTTRAVGTVLTADIYNADHQKHVTNHNPQGVGGYSDTPSQYQATTDPGGLGSESLAGSLAGELERLRYCIKRIVGQPQWYMAPPTDLTTDIVNDSVTNAKLANMAAGTYKMRVTGSTGDPEDATATQATAGLNAFVGDSGSGGTKGLVPAPATGDGAAGKLLGADGTWKPPTVVATQAEMEAASLTTVFVPPGRQQHHPAHPKCWFSATGAGALLQSHNITSVADGGAGILTVTIATDFAYADWCCIPGLEAPTTSTSSDVHRKAVSVRQGTQLAGSISLDAHSSNGASIQLGDPTSWYMAGFGDQ